MTVAQQKNLETHVFEIIQASGTPLSIPQIEVKLRNENVWDANTFDVRDAVAELIEERKAEFVPGRLIQAVK